MCGERRRRGKVEVPQDSGFFDCAIGVFARLESTERRVLCAVCVAAKISIGLVGSSQFLGKTAGNWG